MKLSQFTNNSSVSIGQPIQFSDSSPLVILNSAEYLAHGFSVPYLTKYSTARLLGLGEYNLSALGNDFITNAIVITGVSSFSPQSNIEYGKINNIGCYAFLCSAVISGATTYGFAYCPTLNGTWTFINFGGTTNFSGNGYDQGQTEYSDSSGRPSTPRNLVWNGSNAWIFTRGWTTVNTQYLKGNIANPTPSVIGGSWGSTNSTIGVTFPNGNVYQQGIYNTDTTNNGLYWQTINNASNPLVVGGLVGADSYSAIYGFLFDDTAVSGKVWRSVSGNGPRPAAMSTDGINWNDPGTGYPYLDSSQNKYARMSRVGSNLYVSFGSYGTFITCVSTDNGVTWTASTINAKSKLWGASSTSYYFYDQNQYNGAWASGPIRRTSDNGVTSYVTVFPKTLSYVNNNLYYWVGSSLKFKSYTTSLLDENLITSRAIVQNTSTHIRIA